MILGFLRRLNESTSAREARARARRREADSRIGDDFGAMRAPLRPQDLALTELARAWMDALPAKVRPAALAAQYPRVVNRVALCWRDPALTRQVFDSLLVDRRGRRRGFPAAVRDELLALRAHSEAHPRHVAIDGLEVAEVEDPGDVDDAPWSVRTRGIGDR